MRPTSPPASRPRKIIGWVLAGLVASLSLFIGPGIAVLAYIGLRVGEPYHIALSAAQNSPEVQAALGAHIHPGFLITGESSYSSTSGTGEISIPIHGNTTSGTLHFKGIKAHGEWIISALTVRVDGTGKFISLHR